MIQKTFCIEFRRQVLLLLMVSKIHCVSLLFSFFSSWVYKNGFLSLVKDLGMLKDIVACTMENKLKDNALLVGELLIQHVIKTILLQIFANSQGKSSSISFQRGFLFSY